MSEITVLKVSFEYLNISLSEGKIIPGSITLFIFFLQACLIGLLQVDSICWVTWGEQSVAACTWECCLFISTCFFYCYQGTRNLGGSVPCALVVNDIPSWPATNGRRHWNAGKEWRLIRSISETVINVPLRSSGYCWVTIKIGTRPFSGGFLQTSTMAKPLYLSLGCCGISWYNNEEFLCHLFGAMWSRQQALKRRMKGY